MSKNKPGGKALYPCGSGLFPREIQNTAPRESSALSPDYQQRPDFYEREDNPALHRNTTQSLSINLPRPIQLTLKRS
jgi:hypothetical protein